MSSKSRCPASSRIYGITDALKRMSKQFGRYYGMDREGLLYPGGLIQPGLGRPAAEVFASTGLGDHRGLVFVDTLDGMPPRLDNLGTIVLDQEYAEGIFIVNAHVLWKAGQPGKPVQALSPPPEGQQSLGSRVGVRLSGIHLQGVLYVAGDVRYAGHIKVWMEVYWLKGAWLTGRMERECLRFGTTMTFVKD